MNSHNAAEGREGVVHVLMAPNTAVLFIGANAEWSRVVCSRVEGLCCCCQGSGGTLAHSLLSHGSVYLAALQRSWGAGAHLRRRSTSHARCSRLGLAGARHSRQHPHGSLRVRALRFFTQVREVRVFSRAAGLGLTWRSTGAPTAGHQAPAGSTVYIFASRGLASCRWRPVTSTLGFTCHHTKSAPPYRSRGLVTTLGLRHTLDRGVLLTSFFPSRRRTATVTMADSASLL